jgi:hypothetical protein
MTNLTVGFFRNLVANASENSENPSRLRRRFKSQRYMNFREKLNVFAMADQKESINTANIKSDLTFWYRSFTFKFQHMLYIKRQ